MLKILHYARKALFDVYNKIIEDIHTLNTIKAIEIMWEKSPERDVNKRKDILINTLHTIKPQDDILDLQKKLIDEISVKDHKNIYEAETISKYISKYGEHILQNLATYIEKDIKTMKFTDEDYFVLKGYKYMLDLLLEKKMILLSDEAYVNLYNSIDNIANTIKELSKHKIMMGLCRIAGISAW